MTIKHQIVSKKQSLMNNSGGGIAGGVGGDIGSIISGLTSAASAMSNNGTSLPALNSIGSQISSLASSIMGSPAIQSLTTQISALGQQMAGGSQGGIASIMGQVQSLVSQLTGMLNPGGMMANILHYHQLDKQKGVKTSAFQDQHTTTWDQSGVTHSSSTKVESQAPNIPHDGNTQVSDNLNVTKIVTASAYDMGSDAQLKSNIRPLPSVRDKLMRLNVRAFEKRLIHYDHDGAEHIHTDPAISSFGLVAQEALKVFPEIVHRGDGFLKVSIDKLVMSMLSTMQEMQSEIDELKNGRSIT